MDAKKVENRASFMARLRPLLPPSTMLDIELAYTLAKFGHRAQKRKEIGPDGEPIRYFEHVRGATLILIDEVRCILPALIIGLLLHDTVEDTKDITPPLIEHAFGIEPVSIVLTVSKVPKDGFLERFLLSTDWRPYLAKACDRLHNLRTLGGAPLAFQWKQVEETTTHYFAVFDRMVQLAPDEYKERVQWIRDEIRAETMRARVRCELGAGKDVV